MKNRKITLCDGTEIRINDAEWRSVANRKEFDEQQTEILRVTRHTSGLMTRVYAMRSVGGKVEAERNEIVLQGGDLKAATQRAIGACGLSLEGL